MISGSPVSISFNAYLAGFIDGDGSIMFSVSKTKRVQPRISVGNSHKKNLLYILKNIGFGSIIELQPQGFLTKRAQKRTHWHIQWVGLQAKEVAKRVYPYLIQKKKQCKNVLAFKAMIPGTGIDKRTHNAQLRLAKNNTFLNQNRDAR